MLDLTVSRNQHVSTENTVLDLAVSKNQQSSMKNQGLDLTVPTNQKTCEENQVLDLTVFKNQQTSKDYQVLDLTISANQQNSIKNQRIALTVPTKENQIQDFTASKKPKTSKERQVLDSTVSTNQQITKENRRLDLTISANQQILKEKPVLAVTTNEEVSKENSRLITTSNDQQLLDYLIGQHTFWESIKPKHQTKVPNAPKPKNQTLNKVPSHAANNAESLRTKTILKLDHTPHNPKSNFPCLLCNMESKSKLMCEHHQRSTNNKYGEKLENSTLLTLLTTTSGNTKNVAMNKSSHVLLRNGVSSSNNQVTAATNLVLQQNDVLKPNQITQSNITGVDKIPDPNKALNDIHKEISPRKTGEEKTRENLGKFRTTSINKVHSEINTENTEKSYNGLIDPWFSKPHIQSECSENVHTILDDINAQLSFLSNAFGNDFGTTTRI